MQPEEFERLFEAHAGPLLAFLEYRTGNLELARDIHADTFERVLKSRWRFDRRKGSEKTWLYTIALNVLRDQGRRRAAEARALERLSAGSEGDSWSAVDERVALLRALAGLPEDERDALALRYGADLTNEEVARVTGTKVTTVKGRIERGLRRLRETVD